MQTPTTEWSLTRRLAVIFAVANGLVLLAYTLVLANEVVDILRDDVRAFMEHELNELAQEIDKNGATPESIQASVERVARVAGEPSCGLRVRDLSGEVVAMGGDTALLALVPDVIPEHTSWRGRLVSDHVAMRSLALPKGLGTAEIVVDASETVDRMLRFLATGLAMFLGAITATSLVGWFTAHRGLRSLRDVVSQAGGILSPTDAVAIRLDGAPREVREVGQALNALLERLRATLQEMRAFTAGLAHELRSPLQNLIGETEVTLMSLRSSEEYRDVLRSNLEDLYDLTDAVDNLVTFCRTAEPVRPGLETERFDLGDEARLRLAREQRVAERKGVRLSFADEGDTQLEADRESCLRVLRNLVGNAILWTPAGGSVHARVEGSAEAVRIIVDDEGPGVSPELGDRIFEPFVTGQKRKGKRGGYGLGLAICRTVLQDHGGQLAYERSPSGGARFIASFPRRPPGASSAVEPALTRS